MGASLMRRQSRGLMTLPLPADKEKPMNGRTNSALGLRHVAWPLLALVAALAVSRHAGWGQTGAPRTLEGTWIVTATPDGAPAYQELWTFTSNGGFVRGPATNGQNGPAHQG